MVVISNVFKSLGYEVLYESTSKEAQCTDVMTNVKDYMVR